MCNNPFVIVNHINNVPKQKKYTKIDVNQIMSNSDRQTGPNESQNSILNQLR